MRTLLTPVLLFCIAVAAFSQNNKPTLTIAKADSLLFAGDYKSARDIYRKVMDENTKNPGAWTRYGLSNLNLKNYEEAVKWYESALTQKPPARIRVNTFAGLSRAYANTNNNAKAVICLDSAAALGYLNLQLVDTHDDFKALRNEPRFKEVRQRIYLNANPCMTDPKAREFDFWLGEWDVYVTGTKNIAGHNKIELSSGGCALLENWDSNASSGKSLNFIDPATGKWRQTWVGSYAHGSQDFTHGEYKDGAMRFVFEGTSNGQKFIGRFIFFNEKPGQVRQFNETSTDGGKTWVTAYDFTYVRRE